MKVVSGWVFEVLCLLYFKGLEPICTFASKKDFNEFRRSKCRHLRNFQFFLEISLRSIECILDKKNTYCLLSCYVHTDTYFGTHLNLVWHKDQIRYGTIDFY